MEKFDKTKNYLILINSLSDKKGVFKCGICGSFKELHFWKIKSNHDKSCGCVTGKNKLNFNILNNGLIVSDLNIVLNSKMAKGYEGFKSMYVHRLVAEKYILNPNNYTDVNHKNGIKTDNRVENLEWCSRSVNIKHAWDNKLNKGVTGLANKKRKLTYNDALEIRNSKIGCVFLSRKYNVSKPVILNIRNNKTYKSA